VRHRLLRAIQESRRRIDVAVYTITAVELAEALSAAKVRGLHTWALVDQEKAVKGRSGLRQVRSHGLTV
jgi:hypothetical protein